MCPCDADIGRVCRHCTEEIRRQVAVIERVCAGSGGLYNSAMEGLREEYGSRRVDIVLASEVSA